MRAIALLPALMLACAGCGYRGPLYLPPSKPAAQVPVTPGTNVPPQRPEPSEAIPKPR